VRIVTNNAHEHTLRALGPAPPELFWQNPKADSHDATARTVLQFHNGMPFLSKRARFAVEGR